MRILPRPWEGLHPAFPKSDPPLPASNYVSALNRGATAGIFGVALGSFFRGRPTMGLTVAAYTALLVGCGFGVVDSMVGAEARKYLETKDIEVPKRKLVENLGTFDEENALLMGAVLGVIVAGRRIRPQHMSRFSWYGGAACFGTMGASFVLPYIPWPARRSAVLQLEKKFLIAQRYQEEWAATMRVHSEPDHRPLGMVGFNKQEPGSLEQANQDDAQSTARSGFGILASILDKYALEPLSISLGRTDDAEPEYDDKTEPHIWKIEDGQQTFQPVTNYEWRAGPNAIQQLNEHIDRLTEERQALAKEAELFWYRIAKKEAEFYKTASHLVLKQEQRAALAAMNQAHVAIWKRVSALDWMIADSKKNILQLQAMANNTHWIPPLPDGSESVNTKYTINCLHEQREMIHELLNVLRELAMARGSGQSVVSPDGIPDEPEQVVRLADECANRLKALHALIEETESGKTD